MGNIEGEKKENVEYSNANDTLTFRVVPSTQYALKGVKNTVPVLFQIETGMPEYQKNKERPPISIAIVLDRSSSMAGSKIKESKEAIRQMIYQLEERDQLHLIVYDSQVNVIFEDGDLSKPELLEQQLEAIKTQGCTNMGDALETATDILIKRKRESIDVQRIFLFSDGLVNEGKYRNLSQLLGLASKIYEKGISIISFGIGDDFDEKVMKGIAEQTKNDYFYVEDSSLIEKYVGTVFQATVGSIGSEAKLLLRGINGGILSKVYSDFPDAIIQGVPIGDIKPNNTKAILAEVEISPNQSAEEEEILSYQLSFKHNQSNQIINIDGKLKMKITDDADLVSAKNPETECALAVQRSADIDEHVIGLIDQNKIKEAIEENQKQISLLEKHESQDKTGRITSMLSKVRIQQEEMKDKKTSKAKMSKKAHYHAKLKRYDEREYMCM